LQPTPTITRQAATNSVTTMRLVNVIICGCGCG
jgi:hypothetical protein